MTQIKFKLEIETTDKQEVKEICDVIEKFQPKAYSTPLAKPKPIPTPKIL